VRKAWLVSYDIADSKRRAKVFKTLRGYGDRLQYSVFRCVLGRRERVELQAALERVIKPGDDQVLFASLGPIDGRGAEAVSAIGRGIEQPQLQARIL